MDSKISEILSDEHKKILEVIDVLDKECLAVENGKEIEEDFFKKVIDFIRNYADKFHHAKEEDILFKELNKENVEMNCNPTEQMLYEHEQGRDFVKGMEKRLNENDKIKLIRNARAYSELLKEHIHKEDNILYPMADEVLDQKIKRLILEKFKKIGTERKKDKEKYLAVVNELNKQNKLS